MFVCLFLHTRVQLVHVPRRPPVVLPSPRLSRYPVALLPGQYSDQVRQYSATELNKLPLNTVVDASTIIKKVVLGHLVVLGQLDLY